MKRLIKIFTPSHADAHNTNAQNLTVKEIVARLSPDRFHVSIFSGPGPDPRIANRPNTRLIPQRKHANTPRFLAQLLVSKPDIYFYPRFGPVDGAFYALRRYLRLNTKVVTHVVMVMNDKTAPLNAPSIREADMVLANSRYVADTVRLVFGIDAKTLHNGIDRRFFFPPTELRDSSHSPVVLYAGSFQPRKRVELVIKLATLHPAAEFRLAGSGETETVCRGLVEQLGCRNVRFLGQLDSQELGTQMREADVFLFPSILEGHPQVLGQASACALPAIAMNAYRPDYVIDGRTGFLVESDDELQERLDLLLRDASLRRSLAQAAAQHAAKFDWDRIALQWHDIFEAVIDSARRH
jgi:glycosyltransferase involved in cell wall biosynthesis